MNSLSGWTSIARRTYPRERKKSAEDRTMKLSWSHFVLYVRDEQRMLDFYTRVLGFQVTDRGRIAGRGSDIVFLSQDPAEHHQIALVPTREDDGPSNSLAHIAFRVESIKDLRTMIACLKGDGAAMRPITHGNTWSVYFQDPEQNGIEIFCNSPWHVQQPQAEPWDMSLDDEALLAWTEQRFRDEPGFGPRTDYLAKREKQLAKG